MATKARATETPEVPDSLTLRLEGLLKSQQGMDAGFDESEQREAEVPVIDFEFDGQHYRVTVEPVTDTD